MKFFSNLTLKVKLVLTFAIIIILLGIPLIFEMNSIIKLSDHLREQVILNKVRSYLYDIKGYTLSITLRANKFQKVDAKKILINYKEDYKKEYKELMTIISYLKKIDYNSEYIYKLKNTLNKIENLLIDINIHFEDLVYQQELLIDQKKLLMANLTREKVISNIQNDIRLIEFNKGQIVKLITSSINDIESYLEVANSDKEKIRETIRNLSILIFSFIVLLSLVIIFLISNSISNQLSELYQIIRKVSIGELPEYKPRLQNNEIGIISTSLKSLIDSLKETTQFTAELAKGNFEVEISPLSDKDEFRNLLLDLRDNLRRAKEEQDKRAIEDMQRRKVSEGLAKFADILRGQHKNIRALAENIIIELVRYLDAIQGAFFILNDKDETNPYLELLAAYAWNRKKYFEKKINLGEGLVGAVAVEKFTIYMTDVPEDYIEIKSGIGETDPRAILIVPLLVEDNVLGVIELATMKEFQKYEIELVEKIAESIAATLQNIKINEKTEELLAFTQRQTKEMKRQEEIMKKNIEDLKRTLKEKLNKEEELKDVIKRLEKNISALKIKEKNLNDLLEKAKSQAQEYNYELSIFKNLAQKFYKPIIIIDKAGKIIFSNQLFNEIYVPQKEDTLENLMKKVFGENWNGEIKDLENKRITIKTYNQSYKIKTIYLERTKMYAIVFEPINIASETMQDIRKKLIEYQRDIFILKNLLKKNNIIVEDLKEEKLTIEWKKEYETGIEIIDNQHKKWIDFINQLITAIVNAEEQGKLTELFNNLIEYTQYHFSFEEKYMKEFNYPDYEQHVQVHNNFINKLTNLFNQFLKGDYYIGLQLLDLLIDWVINHVTGTDRGYVRLFKEKGLK